MNVIKVSEILPELDRSIKKKEAEKEQILDLRDSLNKIINLDEALKGNGKFKQSRNTLPFFIFLPFCC